jgi:hypothetical protein
MRRFEPVILTFIIIFCAGLILYVSIPDYPREAPAWEIQLWGEGSQWWSEVSWILMFGASACTAIIFRSWSMDYERAMTDVYAEWGGFVIVCSWLALSLAFLGAYYDGFPGWRELVLLDRGGILHGLFYLGTAHLMALSFIEVLRFTEKSRWN